MKYLIFVMLVFSGSVSATWKHYVYPVEILYEGDSSASRTYIVFDQKFPLGECKQDGHYIRIYGDTKKGQYFISTILTAISAKKKVFPAISGCDDWGRPVLTGLRISLGQ
ncbi:conserved exported hypothetical protein [Vibrio nigripulchritudo SOn1]|uniref:Uncharacterized protein n=1 Tax=Vibrio nigripulchritudo SOn1 TaxID=1238450 RepID=A0AAV2VIY8_9VIBR|nr:hypothetical protein [Vibrio nigripulchritudo]CCO44454.1 conserved exported hypothetical protein [Vibrio nigripulchritudo SOn1]